MSRKGAARAFGRWFARNLGALLNVAHSQIAVVCPLQLQADETASLSDWDDRRDDDDLHFDPRDRDRDGRYYDRRDYGHGRDGRCYDDRDYDQFDYRQDQRDEHRDRSWGSYGRDRDRDHRHPSVGPTEKGGSLCWKQFTTTGCEQSKTGTCRFIHFYDNGQSGMMATTDQLRELRKKIQANKDANWRMRSFMERVLIG